MASVAPSASTYDHQMKVALRSKMVAAQRLLDGISRYVLKTIAREPHPSEKLKLIVEALCLLVPMDRHAQDWEDYGEHLTAPDFLARLAQVDAEGLSPQVVGRLLQLASRFQYWHEDTNLPRAAHAVKNYIVELNQAVQFAQMTQLRRPDPEKIEAVRMSLVAAKAQRSKNPNLNARVFGGQFGDEDHSDAYLQQDGIYDEAPVAAADAKDRPAASEGVKTDSHRQQQQQRRSRFASPVQRPSSAALSSVGAFSPNRKAQLADSMLSALSLDTSLPSAPQPLRTPGGGSGLAPRPASARAAPSPSQPSSSTYADSMGSPHPIRSSSQRIIAGDKRTGLVASAPTQSKSNSSSIIIISSGGGGGGINLGNSSSGKVPAVASATQKERDESTVLRDAASPPSLRSSAAASALMEEEPATLTRILSSPASELSDQIMERYMDALFLQSGTVGRGGSSNHNSNANNGVNNARNERRGLLPRPAAFTQPALSSVNFDQRLPEYCTELISRKQRAIGPSFEDIFAPVFRAKNEVARAEAFMAQIGRLSDGSYDPAMAIDLPDMQSLKDAGKIRQMIRQDQDVLFAEVGKIQAELLKEVPSSESGNNSNGKDNSRQGNTSQGSTGGSGLSTSVSRIRTHRQAFVQGNAPASSS